MQITWRSAASAKQDLEDYSKVQTSFSHAFSIHLFFSCIETPGQNVFGDLAYEEAGSLEPSTLAFV